MIPVVAFEGYLIRRIEIMKIVCFLFGIIFCISMVNAEEKGVYDELDKKINTSLEKKEVSEDSKKEILEFWKLFKECHSSIKMEELAESEIKIMGRSFKVELKEKKPFINIEGHVIPLIIKNNNYIFTTGDIVYKKDVNKGFTIEIFPITKAENEFQINKKELSEINKIIKP